jgi:hypothetical protein
MLSGIRRQPSPCSLESSFTFPGTSGERVSAVSGVASTSDRTTVLEPDGTVLWSSGCCGGSRFTDVLVLPATGTYTLLFDLDSTAVGTMNAQLHKVPAAVHSTLSVGGPQKSLTTTTPGQNAYFTFSGTAGRCLRGFAR